MSGQRRDSVYDATSAFTADLHETLEALRGIWNECGIVDEDRGNRITSVYEHLKTLLTQMIEEETEMMSQLKAMIKTNSLKICKLRKELNMEVFQYDNRLVLLDLQNVLRDEALRLEEIKTERMVTLGKLKQFDQKFCDRLYAETFFIPEGSIPSSQQLADLEKHVQQMEEEFEKRSAEFHDSKEVIGRIYRKMHKGAKSDFEKAVLVESEEEFPLSKSNMDALNVLLLKTHEEYEEHKERLRSLVEEAKAELEDIWTKCCVTDEVPEIDEDNLQDLLDLYQAQVAKWRDYYQSRQAVLSRVENWVKLWQQKLEMDDKESDPNRYKNRGGNLQLELKHKRQLENSLLPRAINEIEAAMYQWKEQHPNEPVLVNNMDPLAYIETTQEEYIRKREIDKRDKEMSKKQKMVEEIRFGTPSMKRKAASPVKATLTPSGKSRNNTQMNTMGISSLAALRSPVRAPISHRPPGLPTGHARTPTGAAGGPPSAKRRAMGTVQETKHENETLVSVKSYRAFSNDLQSGHMNEQQSSFIKSPPKGPPRY